MSKIDSLKFSKETLENNVQNNYITPAKYLQGIKGYRTKVESLLKEATK